MSASNLNFINLIETTLSRCNIACLWATIVFKSQDTKVPILLHVSEKVLLHLCVPGSTTTAPRCFLPRPSETPKRKSQITGQSAFLANNWWSPNSPKTSIPSRLSCCTIAVLIVACSAFQRTFSYVVRRSQTLVSVETTLINTPNSSSHISTGRLES
jgi:hypothetical protein